MATQAELLALAERCEKATGPDRALDAEIAVALKIGARGILPDDHEYLAKVRKDDGCAVGTYWFVCRSGRSLRTSETYTASLDAAMELIGGDWEIGVMWNHDEREAFATVGPNALAGFSLGEGKSKSLAPLDAKARALCAAALRARAATTEAR